MTTTPYKVPQFSIKAFNCPDCQAYSNQTWRPLYTKNRVGFGVVQNLMMCTCAHCGSFSLWNHGTMVFPFNSVAPLAHQDLPEAIKRDFDEARTIFSQSPRGAAALLRLAIQKLCKHLGQPGKDINEDIGALVKLGLPPRIQKSLDLVRVIGNSAVHPGHLDLADEPHTALHLFGLVNLIVDVLISTPAQVDSLYETVVPEAKKKAIEVRDRK